MADEIDDPLPPVPADPTIWDRAAARLGPAREFKPYMVAIDRTTGKALAAWAGTHRHLSYNSSQVAQYAMRTKNAGAARRAAEVVYAQGGRE